MVKTGSTTGNKGGEDEDEEFDNIADKVESTGLSKSFLDWIRLQVDRFQAPRKMTSFLKRKRTPHVDLTLLAVRRPEPKLAGEVLEPWHEMIRYLCAKFKGVKPKETIHILKEKINQGVKKTPKYTIFYKFNLSGAKTYKYNATVHCEAVLATLSKFPSHVAGDSILKECLQV